MTTTFYFFNFVSDNNHVLLTSVSLGTTLKTASYEKKPVRGANQSGSQFKSVLLT